MEEKEQNDTASERSDDSFLVEGNSADTDFQTTDISQEHTDEVAEDVSAEPLDEQFSCAEAPALEESATLTDTDCESTAHVLDVDAMEEDAPEVEDCLSEPSQSMEQSPDEMIVQEKDAPMEEEIDKTESQASETQGDGVATTKNEIVITLSKPLVLICALTAAVVIASSVFLGIWLGSDRIDPWEIDPNAKDYESIHTNQSSSDSIAIPGYADVVFPAKQRNVQLVLLNPEGNPCYFRFSLILRETEEKLYSSGLVPPGQAVTDLRLSRALESGDYHMNIEIETFSLTDELTPLNGAIVEVNLTVK